MPTVSVIIPCYNEEKTIYQLLDGLYHQSFFHEQMEIVIADGLSHDATRKEITRFSQDYPQMGIRVVDNEKRTIPAGLNKAIQAATGEYIIRLDAHSIPNEDYIEKCVHILQDGKAENVGGVWDIQPGRNTWIGRSIAAAAAHPIGVGDAGYRHTRQAGYVDTVPFGGFRREYILSLGGFDESLLTNEDYELNARIRQTGGRVYLDPAIRCTYFARPTLTALARQYWRYGYWKAKMLQRYPQTIRWRQALPPLYILGLLALLVLSIFFAPFWWILLTVVVLYFGILLITSISIALQKRDGAFIMGIPLAIAVMHHCWGVGFLFSIMKQKPAKVSQA